MLCAKSSSWQSWKVCHCSGETAARASSAVSDELRLPYPGSGRSPPLTRIIGGVPTVRCRSEPRDSTSVTSIWLSTPRSPLAGTGGSGGAD